MSVDPQDEFEESAEEPSEMTSSDSSEVEPDSASTDDAFLDGWQLEEDSAETESDAWPADDLESAYRRALEANSSVEWDFDHLPEDSQSEAGTESEADAGGDDAEGSADSASEPSESQTALTEEVPERVSARQVIEAALFVGGEPIAT